MMSDDGCTLDGELHKRSVYAMRREQWGGVWGVQCAWNGASAYNCRPLRRGYSVFIASLKRRKYQIMHKK